MLYGWGESVGVLPLPIREVARKKRVVRCAELSTAQVTDQRSQSLLTVEM